jgi:cytochrome c peroxidase
MIGTLLAAACVPPDTEPIALRMVDGLAVPAGFPDPRVPDDNPITPEKVELGRYLFYDVRLSGNEQQSCGSCHLQELAFTDGLTTAEGSTGMVHPRNSNGLTNVAYNATLTWANPVLTVLETQILIPIFGDAPVELGALGREDEILARLADDPDTAARFEAAYPGEAIDWDTITGGLATFTRTLISGNSPFDQFTYQDDRNALGDAELRGMDLFYSERLECHHCHGGFNFTEASVHADSVFDSAFFHNTGLYNLDGAGAYPADNTGILEVTGAPEDMGRFRAPSLRNVAVTGPYMHDGSIETLEEVVRHYEAGGRLIEDGPYAGDGRESPLKSGLVPGFTLTDGERDDLLAFLEALTDPTFLTDPALSDPYAP